MPQVRTSVNRQTILKERKRNHAGSIPHCSLFRRAVPNAAAECRDVDHPGIGGVGNYAMAPFEVVAGDALPMLAAVRRSPRRGLESGGVEHLWIARVDGDVVDVLVPIQNVAPALAG